MSSCGSMPAVGVPVTLRMLSAPEPREQSPKSCTASIMATAFFGLDLADLHIGARRHVRVPAAVALGEIGEARELIGLQDAVWNAQPAHVGILVRRDVKQAEVAPAEIVRGLRIFVLRGLRLEPLVTVERMLLALELLRVRQLAASGEDPSCAFRAAASGPVGLTYAAVAPPHSRSPRRLGDLRPATNPSRYRFCSGSKSPGAVSPGASALSRPQWSSAWYPHSPSCRF